MNSEWNSGGGFPMPQGGDFEIGNWEIHTPQRPIPVRSHATPVNQVERLQGRTNCPVFTGLPNGHGYMQEMPYCNSGPVQNLNLRTPAEEIQSYLGYDVDLARTNQLIGRIAGQSTPIFDMDQTGWSSGSMMSLLGFDTSAFGLSVEGTSNSGANRVQRPWSSIYQPISSGGGDFTTNDLIGNQMNAASTSAFRRDQSSIYQPISSGGSDFTTNNLIGNQMNAASTSAFRRDQSSSYQPISSGSGDFTTNDLIGNQMNAASTSAFGRDHTSTQTTECKYKDCFSILSQQRNQKLSIPSAADFLPD